MSTPHSSAELAHREFPLVFPATAEVAHLFAERRAGAVKYGRDPQGGIPPAAIESHYENDYKWDNCFSAIFLAKHGHINEAMEVLRAVITSARPDGMIPNISYAPGARFVPEQLTFPGRNQSAYSQPTLEASTLLAITEACQTFGVDPSVARRFVEEMYPGLQNQIEYFITDRISRIEANLIGLIHSNENGQDSSPLYNYIKRLKLPRRGPDTPKLIDYYNTAVDIGGMALLSIRNRANNWQTDKIFDYFCHLDPMMNVLFVNDLRSMADLAGQLGRPEDALQYKLWAGKIEKAIIETLWDPKARDKKGAFRARKNPQNKGTALTPDIFVPSLQKPGFVDEDTVSCLFPIMLDNLPLAQLEALVDNIEQSYSSPYMLPSVATDSPNYDPHMQQKIMWDGPVWAWMNYLIGGGLNRQISRLRNEGTARTH